MYDYSPADFIDFEGSFDRKAFRQELHELCAPADTPIDSAFCSSILEAVQNLLGSNYTVEYVCMQKNNGTFKEGILVKKDGDSVAPTCHLKPYYNRHVKKGVSISALACDIVRDYFQAAEEHDDIKKCCNDLINRTSILNNVVYRIVNRDYNREFLEKIPYSPVDGDLVKIFYVEAVRNSDMTGIITITDALMEQLGITLAELEEYSEDNTPNLKTATFESLGDVLKGICKDIDFLGLDSEMWVLSNEDKVNGASVIYYDGLLESISEQLQSDLYIIPSSIHEVLLVKASLPDATEFLKDTICSINGDSSIMYREDILSDHLFYYKRHSNQISVV